MSDEPSTLTTQVCEFTSETTFHGLGRIKPRENKFKSILWLAFFLVFLGYLCYIMTNACRRYLKRDISTKLTVEEEASLLFPTVTLCSFNTISKAHVEKDDFTKNLVLGMSTIRQSQSNLDFEDPAVLQRIAEINMYQFYKDATPNKTNLFIQCSWKGSVFTRCSDQFEEVLTPWGFCYSFNGRDYFEKNGQYRTITRVGSAHGLWLQITAEQHDYFLQQTGVSAAGYKVLLHDPNTVPRINELGFVVSPGRETLVAVTEVRVKKLPPPYIGSNCTDMTDPTFTNSLTFYKNYSKEACRAECETNFIFDRCNCTPYFYPYEYRKNDTHEMACDCNEPCDNTYYSASVSSAEYPSDLVVQNAVQTMNVTEDFIRKNYLELQIYHEALSYEKIEQQEAYSASDLQADIGGNMGLCIGGSFISILELIEFIVLLCYNGCRTAGKAKVTPNADQWAKPSEKPPIT